MWLLPRQPASVAQPACMLLGLGTGRKGDQILRSRTSLRQLGALAVPVYLPHLLAYLSPRRRKERLEELRTSLHIAASSHGPAAAHAAAAPSHQLALPAKPSEPAAAVQQPGAAAVAANGVAGVSPMEVEEKAGIKAEGGGIKAEPGQEDTGPVGPSNGPAAAAAAAGVKRETYEGREKLEQHAAADGAAAGGHGHHHQALAPAQGPLVRGFVPSTDGRPARGALLLELRKLRLLDLQAKLRKEVGVLLMLRRVAWVRGQLQASLRREVPGGPVLACAWE